MGRRLTLPGAALLALALWAGPAAAQELATLSLDQSRRLAERAALAGEDALALDLARALLRADPEDRDALTVLAVVLPRQGEAAEGRRAAGRAWALSDTAPERFEAARLAAAAALAEGRPLLAEVWLRLALLSAPTPEAEARTLEDARAVRARSPWRIDLELGLAPSDNVNGGAESPFNVVDGLPFVGAISVDGQALSGWVGTAELRATRRLAESRTRRTELRFRLSGRGVALSEEARDRIRAAGAEGEVTGADFGSVAAEVGVGHDRLLGWGLVGGEAALGWSRSGEDPATGALRLSGFAARELGERQGLRLSAHAEERRDGEAGGAGDRRRLGAELAWGLRLREADRLTLALSRAATLSDNGNQASQGWGLRAGYALGEPVGPARLSATLGASWTEYPDYAVIFPVPGGRQDERVFARIEASFEDWSVAGFAPVVTFDAARTRSNVSRFDTETVGLGVTLRSTF